MMEVAVVYNIIQGATKSKGTGIEGRSSIFGGKIQLHTPSTNFTLPLESVSNAKDIDDKSSEWLTYLHNNRVGATSELFNFVFVV